jgi:GNAT superfamily N-acetyltransferase
VKIRPARPSDWEAIARFCLEMDPDDYVPEWMGRFTGEGRFFLLIDGTKFAGLVHGKLAPDGSAWLSAARVHADYRGQGWINRLNDFALQSADLKGAHAARMLITNDNASSLRAAEKGGYQLATRLSFVEWEAEWPTGRPRGRRSGFARTTSEDFRTFASMAPVPSALAGMAYMSFAGAFELNDRALREASTWMYRSPSAGPLLAQVFPDTGERWMAAQPFAATGEVANRLVDFAIEQRAESMTAILPDVEHFVEPFLKAGYRRSDWAVHVNILEKRLRAAATLRARRRAAR